MTQTAWQHCTHLVPLARALADTKGGVLEVGMGDASTPWLSFYCWAAQRRLVSVDDKTEWVDKFSVLPHGGRYLVDYGEDLPRLATEHWSVVLVDHWPGDRRAKDALLFRRSAEIVLVHDFAKLARSLQPIMREWTMAEIVSDTLVLTA